MSNHKKIYLIFLIAFASALVATVVTGVFKIYVLHEPNPLEFAVALPVTFFFMLLGVALLGYEGTGTPENMVVNGLFYVFLAGAVVFLILFLKAAKKVKERKTGFKYIDQKYLDNP
ncbi:MAG: hypothetical protein FWD58_01090 [Firmicutes bacterium]|nr:hypothetical protein [Bacillota bacterium]